MAWQMSDHNTHLRIVLYTLDQMVETNRSLLGLSHGNQEPRASCICMYNLHCVRRKSGRLPSKHGLSHVRHNDDDGMAGQTPKTMPLTALNMFVKLLRIKNCRVIQSTKLALLLVHDDAAVPEGQ